MRVIVSNPATRIITAIIGLYGGLLGAAHGFFELRQGNVPTGGISINAIGPLCHAEVVWHACFPAITLIPNFLAAGIATVIVGLSIATWAAAFVQSKRDGMILGLLSIILLLVGGGFIPPALGILAGGIATQVNRIGTRTYRVFTGGIGRILSKLWPWSAAAYVGWIIFQVTLSSLNPTTMVELGGAASLITNLFLILMILSAFGHDCQSETEKQVLYE